MKNYHKHMIRKYQKHVHLLKSLDLFSFSSVPSQCRLSYFSHGPQAWARRLKPRWLKWVVLFNHCPRRMRWSPTFQPATYHSMSLYSLLEVRQELQWQRIFQSCSLTSTSLRYPPQKKAEVNLRDRNSHTMLVHHFHWTNKDWHP